MKNKLQLLLVMIVSILTSSFPSFAYNFYVDYDFFEDGIYYKVKSESEKTCEVTRNGYAEYKGDVIIPSVVVNGNDTLSVIGIKEYTFYNCTELNSVTIPNSVTYIGNNAFELCGIRAIAIPNSVTEIGERAFSRTDFSSITIPNSVTKIGDSAFASCHSLISVTIPNSVTYIGYYTFGSCRSLTSVTIPNSVTEIGESAFAGCDSLTSVTIPNSVTKIGKAAFSGCDLLTSVTLSDSLTYIGEMAFFICHSLTSVTIPNSVTYIGERAFTDCGFTSMTIPNSVTEIGEYAFSSCDSLTSVTISNSVNEIRKSTFDGCRSLTSVTIPNSVTKIGEYAFSSCESLAYLTIPNSVTEIGEYAFYGCKSLNSIKLSDSLETLKIGVFKYCGKLESLTIPGSMGIIYAYYYYHGGEQNPFYGCYALKSLELNYGENPLEVRDYDHSFLMGWKELAGVTNGIKNLYIDRILEKISGLSFRSLTDLTIGTHITDLQISGEIMPKLERITCLATTPPTNTDFTDAQYASTVVKVPYEALEAYKNAEGWKNFSNLEGFDPAGIDDIKTDLSNSSNCKEVSRYNLNGQAVSEDYKGVVIVRFSDGKTKKIMQ